MAKASTNVLVAEAPFTSGGGVLPGMVDGSCEPLAVPSSIAVSRDIIEPNASCMEVSR